MKTIISPIAQRIIFQDSLPAKNMAKTSQIMTTIDADKYDDVFRNRFTHSIEVAEFCRLISINLGFPKNTVEEIANVGLAHDLGHPPFGHKGAEILNETFIEAGLKEGFKDNSNNFSILFNNKIYFSNYTLVSLIKYPKEIYEEHKELLEKLKKVCIQDAKQYHSEISSTTIGCKIMDFADTISYGGSDIVDGFTTGYTRPHFSEFIKKCILLSSKNNELNSCFQEIDNNIDSKRTIRIQMALIKLIFVNNVILENGNIKFEDNSFDFVLEEMQRFSYDYFINNPKIMRSRNIKNGKFKKVIQTLISYPSLIPSTLYKKKYNKSRSNKGRLRVIRDCIGDMSDDYAINLYKKFKEDGYIS